METALIFAAIVIGLVLFWVLSTIIAIGSFVASICFFVAGEVWPGIGMLLLAIIAGAISNARDRASIIIFWK